MKTVHLKGLIMSALLAALTAVFSQIAIPLPFTPLPINLATLAVFLAGGLLGSRYGLISQIVYILLGLVGLPVFAQFTGGPGILFGPTGGYIFGYALAAFVVGMLFDRTAHHRNNDRDAAREKKMTTKTSVPGEKNACDQEEVAPHYVQHSTTLRAVLFFVAGMFSYYIPGTLWFMVQTESSFAPALVMCVLPFLPGDALKVVAAVLLTRRLRPLLHSL